MTVSALAGAIITRLEAVGYRRVPTPFQVASVRFDFTARRRLDAALKAKIAPEALRYEAMLVVELAVKYQLHPRFTPRRIGCSNSKKHACLSSNG
jgi:hypothetical protein